MTKIRYYLIRFENRGYFLTLLIRIHRTSISLQVNISVFQELIFFLNEYVFIKDTIDEQTEKSLSKLLFDYRTRLVKAIARRDSLFCCTAMLITVGCFPRKRYLSVYMAPLRAY